MPKLRKFFTKTALGRTLSGRNKTGQAIGAVVKPILIATGLKPVKTAYGHITDALDGEEIAKAKNKPANALRLNLTAKEERYVRLAVLVIVVLLAIFGVDVTDLMASVQGAIEGAGKLLGAILPS